MYKLPFIPQAAKTTDITGKISILSFILSPSRFIYFGYFENLKKLTA